MLADKKIEMPMHQAETVLIVEDQQEVPQMGYTDDGIGHRDLAEDGQAHLQKPFAPPELAAKVRETPGVPGPGTVLVVDDEDAIRGLFHELLTAEGYRVLVASDGRQACDMLRRGMDLDLVITDLVMPNQEGIETIQAMRQQFPKVRIIAMSGAFGGQFLSTAKLLGADATLMKPVPPHQLCVTVAEVLSRR
jgi:CheY-like chemotaxis protein